MFLVPNPYRHRFQILEAYFNFMTIVSYKSKDFTPFSMVDHELKNLILI